MKLKSLTSLLSKIIQPLLIVGLILYLVYSGNRGPSSGATMDQIDSIMRIIKVPEQTGNFNNPTPQPIVVVVPQPNSQVNGLSNNLLRQFEEMRDDNAKTRAYAKAIALKVYENKYSDSIVDIIVKDSVEGGELTAQNVKWKVKPQEIKYYEKAYYFKPRYSISGKIDYQATIDSIGFYNEKLLTGLEYRGRKGWGFSGAVNILTGKEYQVGISKTILTKFEKTPKLE